MTLEIMNPEDIKECPKCGIKRTVKAIQDGDRCKSIGEWDISKNHPNKRMELFNCECETTFDIVIKRVEEVLKQ